MAWVVRLKKSKQLKKLDRKKKQDISDLLMRLVKDLKTTGPVQGKWSNYSKLSDGSHHCHLTYSFVACWKETKKGLEIEVYYVGSRENAPY